MKRTIKSFDKQKLNKDLIDMIKGGGSFCEWYLGYCNNQPDPAILQYMIQLDIEYGFLT